MESDKAKSMLTTYGEYMTGKATKEDMEQANSRFRDLLKAVGMGGFCVLPGTVVTLPLILMAAKKLNIDLLPKSFYEQFPSLKGK